MHPSSIEKMKKFVDENIDQELEPIIIDFGSKNINGSYSGLFNENVTYVGIDIEEGDGVEFEVETSHEWTMIEDGYVDFVISGQMFNEIDNPSEVFIEIARVLKPGGKCCIITPYSTMIQENRRLSSSKLNSMAVASGLSVKECFTDGSSFWKDSVIIAAKPEASSGQQEEQFEYDGKTGLPL